MGNDGGSIPDRRDLVKSKPKAEQADKANQQRARWLFCALSKRKLQTPIVSCALGKLYNKDAIVEYLLDRTAYGDGDNICGHIRSLKDVKTLNLTPNTAASSSDDPLERVSFVCPFNLKEMNGSQPFVYITTCGCVFSQAGMKTVTASSSPKEKEKAKEEEKGEVAEAALEETMDLCPQCGKKYNPAEDVITLNPSEDEEWDMRLVLERKRRLEPPKKKSKKRKNESPDADEPAAKKSAPTLNPSIAAASRAAVSGLAMEGAKRKAAMSDAVKSLYSDGKPNTRETFMTRGTFTRYA